MIRSVLQRLNPWGPLLFGLGFIAPLVATLTTRSGLELSVGFSDLDRYRTRRRLGPLREISRELDMTMTMEAGTLGMADGGDTEHKDLIRQERTIARK
jgi:hypothetical protein